MLLRLGTCIFLLINLCFVILSSAVPVDNTVNKNNRPISSPQTITTKTTTIRQSSIIEPVTLISHNKEEDTLFIQDNNNDDVEEESLIASLLMIGISEIGDKTFLIAAVMAMKHPRWAVFTGAFSALCLMAVVSSLLGRVVPQLIPKNYTDMIAAILFFFFGLRMAWEAHCMKKQEQQHYTAVDKTDDEDIEDMTTIYHENNKAEYQGSLSEDEYEHEEKKIRQKQQPVLVEAFILTFLGEWGDKSQISTIALAASNDVLWVTIGVIVGHGICTGLAVLGGRLIADRISVRTVAMVGSFMFILFGCVYIHHAIYLQE